MSLHICLHLLVLCSGSNMILPYFRLLFCALEKFDIFSTKLCFLGYHLQAMASLMVESTTKMIDKWSTLVSSGMAEIDVESEIVNAAAEIIAKTSFGISFETGRKVFAKLREIQVTLFQSNRFVGVPFGKLMVPIKSMKAKRLGKEIDGLLLSIINDRKKSNNGGPQQDLLGLLLADSVIGGNLGNVLTARELVDECKTFFFGGHETTALALTWTMLLLATHPDWQTQLREEIKEVIGEGDQLDFTKLNGLKKVKTQCLLIVYCTLLCSVCVPRYQKYHVYDTKAGIFKRQIMNYPYPTKKMNCLWVRGAQWLKIF